MSANVETMFYVRQAPWHGLGRNVKEALNSREALRAAGLDWTVEQSKIYTDNNQEVTGFRANIRSSDQSILGIVSNRYSVVQNDEAFSFTDALLGEGVRYETAGSLNNGKKVWMLAKLPDKFQLLDDEVCPYLVFSNSHDGSGCIKVAMTPIRVVCQNTLNLALKSTKRSWSTKHLGEIKNKLDDAITTLNLANRYLNELSKSAVKFNKTLLDHRQVKDYTERLLPYPESANRSPTQEKNIENMRQELYYRYYDAPDLQHVEHSAYRYINAVSDFATHSEPLRKTKNYRENLFAKVVEGHSMIDKAYEMIQAASLR